ncbi:MAG: M23 family metallopeptidase [Marinifilaceae bacterium]|nr:M23 family metallopeptidase [Marinifilaceae bacterium]
MAKIRYQFNKETLSYDKIEISFRKKALNWLTRIGTSILWGAVIAVIAFTYIDSPKEATLKEENAQLLAEYNILNKELDELSEVITALEHRDDNMYRVIFESDPIDPSIRQGGIGGSDRYAILREMNNSELLISTNEKLDRLTKAAYIQSKSFDEIEVMVKNKIDMLASIPAILPVSLKDKKVHKSSGFGYRIHPIYKTRKFHAGVDFSGPIGTPIYATGNGKVIKVGTDSGYGKHVIIDHGYSYKTHYAHMSAYTVKRGQKVKRGEIIGFLGNSGRSTGPHCHYEVLKNDIAVNPINYFFNDLTPDEYEKLVNSVDEAGQSLD